MLVNATNISEGRPDRVAALVQGLVGVLDVHTDVDHHRAVVTTADPGSVRTLARRAVETIDLRRHSGVHPRLGAVDVVPFVPYGDSTLADALAARNAFVTWCHDQLALPALVYGDDGPTLPELRRTARLRLLPHPTAGAVAVSARRPLVAYNVWLRDPDLALARRIASTLRSPQVRALGLPVGARVQVSMNLLDPLRVGPAEAFDAVAALAPVAGAELVGLVPDAVLQAVPKARWIELGLDARSSVEARLTSPYAV